MCLWPSNTTSPSYNNLSAVSSVYKLVQRFPAFNSSLAYDPSLNLISVGVGLIMMGGMVVGIMVAKWRWRKLKSALDKGPK